MGRPSLPRPLHDLLAHYTYCSNSPTDRKDPRGLQDEVTPPVLVPTKARGLRTAGLESPGGGGAAPGLPGRFGGPEWGNQGYSPSARGGMMGLPDVPEGLPRWWSPNAPLQPPTGLMPGPMRAPYTWTPSLPPSLVQPLPTLPGLTPGYSGTEYDPTILQPIARPFGGGAGGRGGGGDKVAPPAAGDAGDKRGPKPKGVGPHNETILRRIEELKKSLGPEWEHTHGGTLKEEIVRMKSGEYSYRRPDITFKNQKTGQVYRENVGRTDAEGKPIQREREALDDLQRATGERPGFTPYDR